MYSRNYSSADNIPPNYKGTAFDTCAGREQKQKPPRTRPDRDNICSKNDNICEKNEERPVCDEAKECAPICKECDICENKEEKNDKFALLSSLFSRGDKKSPELDDLILGGLIILLLNNHADDELLLILALLFFIGL